MPESKTIEIDEILTPGKSAPKSRAGGADTPPGGTTTRTGQPGYGSADPFADFHKALPWRARITIMLTRWLMLLRSKSWGKYLIIPAVILALLLAIPLGIIAALILVVRKLVR